MPHVHSLIQLLPRDIALSTQLQGKTPHSRVEEPAMGVRPLDVLPQTLELGVDPQLLQADDIVLSPREDRPERGQARRAALGDHGEAPGVSGVVPIVDESLEVT